MNRFKKELMKKGVTLEHQYECMPFDGIQAVIVNSQNATVIICHTSISTKLAMDRAGDLAEEAWW